MKYELENVQAINSAIAEAWEEWKAIKVADEYRARKFFNSRWAKQFMYDRLNENQRDTFVSVILESPEMLEATQQRNAEARADGYETAVDFDTKVGRCLSLWTVGTVFKALETETEQAADNELEGWI